MSADNGKPSPGGGDVPARGGEADLAAEIERLRLQLDDVSRQLSDSERRRLEAEAKRAGWKLPKVCTPPELMGDSTYEIESNS